MGGKRGNRIRTSILADSEPKHQWRSESQRMGQDKSSYERTNLRWWIHRRESSTRVQQGGEGKAWLRVGSWGYGDTNSNSQGSTRDSSQRPEAARRLPSRGRCLSIRCSSILHSRVRPGELAFSIESQHFQCHDPMPAYTHQHHQ